jgi:hypothetical protein
MRWGLAPYWTLLANAQFERCSLKDHLPHKNDYALDTTLAYIRFMEQHRRQTIPELETTLTILHRREMRLRSVLSCAFIDVDNRLDAREALERILEETREIEDNVSKLEKRQ